MIENSVSSPERVPAGAHPLLAALRRVDFWKIYLAVLFLGMAGMVATRSAVFPQIMFLATAVYLGGQIIGYGEQTRRSTTLPPFARMLARFRSLPFSLSLVTFLALGFMILSAYLFAPPLPDSDPWNNLDLAGLVMLAGGALVGAAILINRYQRRVDEPTFVFVDAPAFPQPYSLVAVIGILMLLLEAEISGQSLHLDQLQRVSYTIQGALFWGGVGLLAAGMSGTFGGRWLKGLFQRIRSGDRVILALIAIVAFAFALRVWNLNDALRQSMDDGMSFTPVFPLLSDSPDVGLTAIDSQYPQVYSQFMAIGLRIVGFNLAGIHSPNVVIGTLMVIAAFMLGTALFDSRMGLIAALILATFPPHLHLSRITFIGLGDAMMGAFAMAFLVRGLKFNRRADWVLAGVFFGLTQYFYEAGRLFFPVFIPLCLAYLAITHFKRLRSMGRGLSLMLICALIVAIPVYYAMLARNGPFFTRMGDSGTGMQFWVELLQSGNTQEIIRRIALPYLGMVHFPETILYYAGTHPMILEYITPLLFLGLFYLLWQWRKPTFLVALWLLAVPTANLIMVDPIENPRYIIGYTAMALTIAAGICYGLPLLLSAFNRRKLVIGATALLVGAVGVAQVNYYFNEHLPTLIRQIRTQTPYPDIVDAALRITDLPGGTKVYFISDVPADSSVATTFIGVLRWEHLLPYVTISDLAPDLVTPEFLTALPLDKDYAFFVEPGHDALVKTLQANFVLDPPQYTTQTDMPPGKAFIVYFAPLDQQPQAPPAAAPAVETQ